MPKIISNQRAIKKILKNLKLTNIEGISFDKKTILIDGYKHLYTICGNVNAESNQTLIMMGGIPSDPSESLYWMASELIKKNPSLKIIIIHLPFYEHYSKIELTDDTAKFNTLIWDIYLSFLKHKSYSQYGEDLIIDSFFKHHAPIKSGNYLDIGCYHPVGISNTYLLHRRGWQGLVVDIDDYKLELFKR